MSNTLQQDISALMDGELDELGIARVLAESDQAELRDQLHRFSVARSMLHNESVEPVAMSMDISQAVRQSIENIDILDAVTETPQEDVPSTGKVVPFAKWLQPAVGFAVAASVAFLMVFSVDYWKQLQGVDVNAFAVQENVQQDVHAEAVASAVVANTAPVVNVSTDVSWAEQELNDPYHVVVAADQELRRREEALIRAQQENTLMQQRLREYLIRHSQQTSAINPVNDVVPITRASHLE